MLICSRPSRAARRATCSRISPPRSSFGCWTAWPAASPRSLLAWPESCSASSLAQHRTRTEANGTQALTEREREVLDLLVQGVTSNRELADRLVVSENTVKYHLRNILDKLHVQNRTQVVAYAVRHGLLDAPPDLERP